jgi:hypothetical protein
MSDIVEKIRAAADDVDAVENASVAYLLEEAAAEIERLRLTDEEREAIDSFARDNWAMSPVLRSLLERL